MGELKMEEIVLKSKFLTKELIEKTYNLSEVAEFLNIKGLVRNKLMEILMELRILDRWNFANDDYIDAGYFSFRTRYVNRNHIYNATSVLGKKGFDFLRETVSDYLKKEKKYEQ